jgi:hypothetical protein
MQINRSGSMQWGLSRAKALVGAVATALALAVSVQAVAPDSASAMKRSPEECMRLWVKIVYAEDHELWNDADFYGQLFTEGNCAGVINGT